MFRLKNWIACICVCSLCLTGCSNDGAGKSETNEKEQAVSDTQDTENKKETDITEMTEEELSVGYYSYEYTKRDQNADWEKETQTKITGQGSDATIDGDGAVFSDGEISISKAGTYVLSGNFTDTGVVVDAKDEQIRLVFNGVKMHHSQAAPIRILDSKKVVVTLADGTQNVIADERAQDLDPAMTAEETDSTEGATDSGEKGEDSSSETGEDLMDAAIYSKEDLTFNGTGTLDVSSKANHGIVSKDGLVIMSGTFSVNAAKNGIKGKDYLVVADGDLTVTAGNDCLKSSNDTDSKMGFVWLDGGNFDLNAGHDGIQAKSLAYVGVVTMNIITNNGSASVQTTMGTEPGADGEGMSKPGFEDKNRSMDGVMNKPAEGDMPKRPTGDDQGDASMREHKNHAMGGVDREGTNGESYRGIKATKLVYIDGAKLTIDSYDDAIHGSEGNTQIVSGTLDLTSGDDGLNAEKDLIISGGTITIHAKGDGIDSNTNVTQSGGTLILQASSDGGNGALDYADTYLMNGGSNLAFGNTGMMMTISDDSSACMVSLSMDDNIASKTDVTVTVNGEIVQQAQTEKEYNCIQFASDEIKKGDTVEITVGSDSYEVEVTDTNMKIGSDGSVSTGERAEGMGKGGGRGDFPKMKDSNPPDSGEKPGI